MIFLCCCWFAQVVTSGNPKSMQKLTAQAGVTCPEWPMRSETGRASERPTSWMHSAVCLHQTQVGRCTLCVSGQHDATLKIPKYFLAPGMCPTRNLSRDTHIQLLYISVSLQSFVQLLKRNEGNCITLKLMEIWVQLVSSLSSQRNANAVFPQNNTMLCRAAFPPNLSFAREGFCLEFIFVLRTCGAPNQNCKLSCSHHIRCAAPFPLPKKVFVWSLFLFCGLVEHPTKTVN